MNYSRLFIHPASLCLPLALLLMAAGPDGYGDKDSGPPTGKDLVKPAPGVAKVKPVTPTWCKKSPEAIESEVLSSYLSWSRELAQRFQNDVEENEGAITLENLRYLSHSACIRPKDKVRQKWVAQGRQFALNHLGVSDNALQVILGYLSATKYPDDDRKKICKAWEDKVAGSLDEALEHAAGRQLIGCKKLERDRYPWSYMLRQEKPASELVRGALMYSVLRPFHLSLNDSKSKLMSPAWVARFIAANQDYPAMKIKNLLAELKAAKASAGEMAHMIYNYGFTKHYMKHRTAFYKKMAKKSPELNQIIFKAPTKGFKRYLADAKKAKKRLDLAHKYEFLFFRNKRSKKALLKSFAGCNKELRKALIDHIGAVKPKTIDEVIRATSDNFGYTISTALSACEIIRGSDEKAVDSRIFASFLRTQVLSQGIPVFGPRDAAVSAGAYALAEVLKDLDKFPIRSAERFQLNHWSHSPSWNELALKRIQTDIVFPVYGGWTQPGEKAKLNKVSGDAQIKSVKKKGDSLIVSFKTVKWKVPIYKCTPTNRIARIDASGEVHYQNECVPVGKKTRKLTMPPITVPKSLAAPGVKPGRTVRMYSQDFGQPPVFGLILEVYKDKQKKKLIGALGAKL